MPRLVILGTGTGVGKSYFAQRLVRALAAAAPDVDVVGVKPVETGITRRGLDGSPPPRSDAKALERFSRGTLPRPHPLIAFSPAVSPHLAARLAKKRITARELARLLAIHDATLRGWQIIETAGGAFSPLNSQECNVDLARALDPSIWVVVAPDALGVLHDVRATLTAMRACARRPDYLVLSAARRRDASSGTNAAELPRVGLPKPIAVLARGDDGSKALAPLIRRLLRT
ncbi:MAG TPA: dethiobiotin synthase [Polyangiaceae bacterium]|nr:dethiobiotin synthase [Polyangiaceae bacterium]